MLPTLDEAIAASTAGKDKHVIYLYMAGGMSHLDTFDPKPKRQDVQGPATALDTVAPDIQVTKYLPRTAEIADKICVINSMKTNQGAHEQGQYYLHRSYWSIVLAHALFNAVNITLTALTPQT